MSRRERELEELRQEVRHTRTELSRMRAVLNQCRAAHSCPGCTALSYDLDLAREVIDQQAVALVDLSSQTRSDPVCRTAVDREE